MTVEPSKDSSSKARSLSLCVQYPHKTTKKDQTDLIEKSSVESAKQSSIVKTIKKTRPGLKKRMMEMIERFDKKNQTI